MTTTEITNPYGADLTDMPTESVEKLLKAKAADLTWFTRTVRNAIRGARRNGVTYYVGRTYTGAHIATDATSLPVVDFAALPDGRVVKFDGAGSAYSKATA